MNLLKKKILLKAFYVISHVKHSYPTSQELNLHVVLFTGLLNEVWSKKWLYKPLFTKLYRTTCCDVDHQPKESQPSQ